MSELRKDPIVGRWVIVAKNRAERPHDFAPEPAAIPGLCPFCEHREHETPGEILALRGAGSAPDGPGWQIRVVPNKFPALDIHGSLPTHHGGIYDALPGVGAHEVIIESPEHITSTSQLDTAQLASVLVVYRDRLIDLGRDKRLVYGMVFKNVGAAAGASLEHSHSQLIATPIVPITVREEIEGSLDWYNRRGQCAYCELAADELRLADDRAENQRVVSRSDAFIAFCPFASRFPFETWILPREHASGYESLTSGAAADLANVLKDVIRRIESALEQPAYNYILHTAPFDSTRLDHYHWHIEIIPRLTKIAGFEWGTGFYINPVPPEEAARILRHVDAHVVNRPKP